MARRQTPLVTGEYYHVFNRGVEQRQIYGSSKDYTHFLELLRFYCDERTVRFSSLTPRERREHWWKRNGQPLVHVICYCLMPNHYHLLLRQERDQGVQQFLHRVGDAYSRYFNTLHRRVGPLFQGTFKAVQIERDAQLLHVSRYIHLNPVAASMVREAADYPWSSVLQYLDGDKGAWCETHPILAQFPSRQAYREFLSDYADYAQALHHVKHALLAV